MDQETQDKLIQHIREYSPEFKKSRRRQYLLGYYRKAFQKQYLKSKKYITDTVIETLYFMEMQDKAIGKGDLAAVVIMTGRIKELVAILVKFQNANYYRGQNMGGDVTNEMIRRAREFPIKELINFNKAGFSFCLWHKEKTPSMKLTNNRVHCFGCGVTHDVIDVYIELHPGLTFPETVKRLQ